MCGIFGLAVRRNKKLIKNKSLYKILNDLGKLSEDRGKDSSGICFKNDLENSFQLIKINDKITSLLKTDKFKSTFQKNYKNYIDNNDFISFGHTRLVTNGNQIKETNNQPICKDNIICIHNGIITNFEKIFNDFKLNRDFEIDSEIIPSLINFHLQNGKTIQESIDSLLNVIEGTISSCIFFNKYNCLALSTNNGSLYYVNSNEVLIFASEKHILKNIIEKNSKNPFFQNLLINQLKINSTLVFDFDKFKFLDKNQNSYRKIHFETQLQNIIKKNDRSKLVDVNELRKSKEFSENKSLLNYNLNKINKIKRCTKCVLPETFPHITFDNKGVCNYCNNYVKRNQPKSLNVLKNLVNKYKKDDGSVDCLIPFSGGRDSTFVLHFAKKILGLNPIAFTYDWGLVTDLARRNIARVCGKLGVENIIIAADISTKRNNIRMNIESWLKRPDLGMIPLFMAGDKQFFKYANMVKDRNDLDLNIWGINFLENTDFKVGFCGVKPDWNKKMIYSMKLSRQLKLFGHISKNIILNPSYINSSVFDTLESFASRYFNPRNHYYHFFDYYRWDESEIENILFNEYNWEKSTDLDSSWRIGDGTASFYNYIYYTVAGFSEFDTFRSNQIREGMISREDAIEMINIENIPRYESIYWYLKIIGLDFKKTINKINSIKKLY